MRRGRTAFEAVRKARRGLLVLADTASECRQEGVLVDEAVSVEDRAEVAEENVEDVCEDAGEWLVAVADPLGYSCDAFGHGLVVALGRLVFNSC